MNYKPEGFSDFIPYLAFDKAAEALEFYAKAFGAKETYRLAGMNGEGVGHAEMKFGESTVMMGDAYPQMGCRSVQSYGGSSCSFVVYVEDADESFEHAVNAGCTVVRPLENMFYGDRSGTVQDPFGHRWTLSTHVEDVEPDEIERRWKAMAAEMSA